VVVFRGTDNWAPEKLPEPSGGFFGKLGHTIGDLVGVSEPNEKDFIKRVIGLPGDTVACCDSQGRVTVNGYSLTEPYIFEDSADVPPIPGGCSSRQFGPITIEPGKMFVMGDHRSVSQDSRCVGPVPLKNVIGRAFVIVWPTSEWSGLPVPTTFEMVPRPLAAAPHAGRDTGGAARENGSGGRVIAAGGWPEVPLQADLFLPLVFLSSHRRVRGVRTGLDDVGSAS
jgi:signal peptidase I